MRVTKDFKINELEDLIKEMSENWIIRHNPDPFHNLNECTCDYCDNWRLYDKIDAVLRHEDELVD